MMRLPNVTEQQKGSIVWVQLRKRPTKAVKMNIGANDMSKLFAHLLFNDIQVLGWWKLWYEHHNYLYFLYLLQSNICDWNNINDLNTDMYIHILRNIFLKKYWEPGSSIQEKTSPKIKTHKPYSYIYILLFLLFDSFWLLIFR